MEPLYTVEQAAEVLHSHPETVREWLRRKKLKGVVAGRRWRIKESDLEAFLHDPDQPAPAAPPASSATPAAEGPLERKAALVARLRQMKAEGRSLHDIAVQLNAAKIPTLSGRGIWRPGTVANLLAEGG